MSARILDGRALAAQLKQQLAQDIASAKSQRHKNIRLVSILVGDDPSSHSYALSQGKTAEGLGIHYELQKLPAHTKGPEILDLIRQLNHFADVHGIIINKPLPSHLDFNHLIEAIAPSKDVEGMTLANLGRLFIGQAKVFPCTPAAAMALLRSSGVPLKGKEAVVIGRSEIVGKPMAILLLQEHVTTTICHSATTAAGKLDEHLMRADIVVAAIGKANFVKGDFIKPGAIVIDVGINDAGGKIVGDVDFESVQSKAGFITPVPGGVGPVTSVMLMRNVLEAFKSQYV